MTTYTRSLTLATGSGNSITQNATTVDSVVVTVSVPGNHNISSITASGSASSNKSSMASGSSNTITFSSTGSYTVSYSANSGGKEPTFYSGQVTGTISSAPSSPTYSLTAPSTISEGSSGTISVSTTNVSNGTTLYWSLAPGSAVSTSTGSVSISSNSASFTASPNSGDGTEPAQTITARLFTDSGRTNQVASDTFVIPANTESGGGGGGGTGGGGAIGNTTHGIEVFSRDGDLVFGTDLRTQNLQIEKSIVIAGNSTSAQETMANANDSTKVVITILGYFPSGGPFTINTSSTGFTITNNTSVQETANVLAFRIG